LGKYNVTNSIVGNALFVKHKRLFFFLNLLAEKRVDKQSLKSNVFCFMVLLQYSRSSSLFETLPSFNKRMISVCTIKANTNII